MNKINYAPLYISLVALLSGNTAADDRFDNYHFDARTPAAGGTIYEANHDHRGIPLDLEMSTEVSVELMDRINLALPERRDVRDADVSLITDDAGGNITMRETGDVFVTFLHEGAGYKNSFGYIAYPVNDPPQTPEEIEHTIVFPNASYPWAGGSDAGLRTGDQVYLGRFEAGTRISFFVVSNGWTTEGVRPNWDHWVFYTLRGLNPETAEDDLNAHTVLLYDPDEEKVVLGMEDIKRTNDGCDHDFNDLLIAIESNPPEAIQSEDLLVINEVSDRDGDGVPDEEDELPDDPLGAFVASYPTADGYATLAFEDNWPWRGDYDFNDLVMRYQLDEIRDINGDVTALRGNFEMMARGAGYRAGFGYYFPELDPGLVHSATITIDDGEPMELVPEETNEGLSLVLVPDVTELGLHSHWCWYFNTQNCAEVEPTPFSIELILAEPVPQADFGEAPYNPFLYLVQHRHHEIHLPNQVPTSRVGSFFFGTRDDASNLDEGVSYLSTNGLPWALNLPVDWHHPMEHIEITDAYPEFAAWAESGGTEHKDWYLHADPTKLFLRTITFGQ